MADLETDVNSDDCIHSPPNYLADPSESDSMSLSPKRSRNSDPSGFDGGSINQSIITTSAVDPLLASPFTTPSRRKAGAKPERSKQLPKVPVRRMETTRLCTVDYPSNNLSLFPSPRSTTFPLPSEIASYLSDELYTTVRDSISGSFLPDDFTFCRRSAPAVINQSVATGYKQLNSMDASPAGSPSSPVFSLSMSSQFSPSRLPSINEFFGNASLTQHYTLHPHKLESLLGEYPKALSPIGDEDPSQQFRGPTSTLNYEQRSQLTDLKECILPTSSIPDASLVTYHLPPRSPESSSRSQSPDELPCRRNPSGFVAPVDLSPVTSSPVKTEDDSNTMTNEKTRLSVMNLLKSLVGMPGGFHDLPVKESSTRMPDPLPTTNNTTPPVDWKTLPTCDSFGIPAALAVSGCEITSVSGISGQNRYPPRQSLRLRNNAVSRPKWLIDSLGDEQFNQEVRKTRESPKTQPAVSTPKRPAPSAPKGGSHKKVKRKIPDAPTLSLPVTPLALKRKTREKPPMPFSVSDVTLRDYRNGVVDLCTKGSLLSFARLERIDIREKFDLMPTSVQYEILALMPASYKVVDADGRISLKPELLTKGDSKFKQRLSQWQANLHNGQFDDDVRHKYIDILASSLDPWKAANFEPSYGDIMAQSSGAKGIPLPSIFLKDCISKRIVEEGCTIRDAVDESPDKVAAVVGESVAK